MADDSLPTVLDWLGREQPLARKSLQLTTSGGGPTAPVTGPSPGQAGSTGGSLTGGGSAAARDLLPSSPSSLAMALRAAGLGESALKLASRFTGSAPSPDVSGTPNPVTPEAEPIAGPEGIEGAVSQIPSTGVPAGTAAAESAATFGGEAAAGTTGAEGAGPVLGAAGAVAGLGLGLSGVAQSKLSDRDKLAMTAHEVGMTAANYAGFGIPAIIDQVIQLFGGPSASSLFADIFGIGGGAYGPARQKAGQEAGADLSGLASQYQGAAASGDLGQVLTALGTGQGERGAVRSSLWLPPEIAQKIGMTDHEWSSLTPAQFSQVLDYFRQNPDAMTSGIQGSGDVAYLNAGQAGQVADAAAQDARALIQFVLSQSPATPTAPTTAPATGAPAGAPATPAAAPLTMAGPSGALGFARDLLEPA